jgi:hypothetical protein
MKPNGGGLLSKKKKKKPEAGSFSAVGSISEQPSHPSVILLFLEERLVSPSPPSPFLLEKGLSRRSLPARCFRRRFA